ncbi:hypothetical protein M758_7G173700 [Ceratodon purpureus]|uniref:ferroxidase n=1 Tax=Ceratodon purpureus TaxID=3225 RepID=A0A8T0HC35_CERPU|nr:hypothetical protein KC19_7G176700 [Ceratodon purpureus]KAG0611892.1 hypothetical protein M758_7G173700 [Ceratodon purpureus]
MRRAIVEVVKRGCSSARPIAAIDGAVAGREISRGVKVVVPAIARWVSSGELLRGFSGGVGCRDGSTGGVNLRFLSSGNGEAESGALVSEKVFHSVANDTLDMLQEKIEAYGEDLDVDGFDLDYSDGVMTIRLGDLGTYVLNKQTPNRQLWLSSPVSGPARFDWVVNENVWVYRRSKAELVSLLEQELSKLLKSPVTLKK